MRKIHHINICGYAGSGKTTIAHHLIEHHNAFMIPRVTSRPRRNNEKNSKEYIFVSKKQFQEMKDRGDFFSVSDTKGNKYSSGILLVELWPKTPENVDIVISSSGINHLKNFKKNAPHFSNIFIDFKDKNILNERLRLRCLSDNSGFEKKLIKNEDYDKSNVKFDFIHQVYNDTTVQDCADQILKMIKK